MLYYVELTSIGILNRLFEKNGKNPISEKLYIKATDIEIAIKKAKKYLRENKCSHLKIKSVEKLNAELLV